MTEYKKVVTKLESSVKPISIDSTSAYDLAKSQNEANNIINNVEEEKHEDKVATPIKAEESNIEAFHAVNDVIKVTKKKTPMITYVIMIAILVALVAIFVIFELPILRGL